MQIRFSQLLLIGICTASFFADLLVPAKLPPLSGASLLSFPAIGTARPILEPLPTPVASKQNHYPESSADESLLRARLRASISLSLRVRAQFVYIRHFVAYTNACDALCVL
jgi:hypothetical protein